MKRDSLFFSYFRELPGSFFQLVGRPESDARRYDLKAIEYKETAVRLDGVFQPLQRMVIQFIETVILYEFPLWSRKEIETMLQVSDVRQTRVYQEALEEGIEKGREEVALRLLKMDLPVKKIVEA